MYKKNELSVFTYGMIWMFSVITKQLQPVLFMVIECSYEASVNDCVIVLRPPQDTYRLRFIAGILFVKFVCKT